MITVTRTGEGRTFELGENTQTAIRERVLAETARTGAEAAETGAEAAATSAADHATAAQTSSRYFATRVAGAAATPTGELFVTDELGKLSIFKRIAGAPNYEYRTDIPSSLGFDIDAAAGNGGASPSYALRLTGGGAATDGILVIDPDDGSLFGLDVRQASTGRQMRLRRADGMIETDFESGALNTAKYVNIGAGIVWTNGLPFDDPAFEVRFYPANQISQMFPLHADTQLASTARGYNGATPMAKLYQMQDGYADRLDMCNGQIRHARPDLRPFIGDVNSAPGTAKTDPGGANPIVVDTEFPLVIEPFTAGGVYGYRLRSSDVATIGEARLFLKANSAIVGDDGSNLLQWESAAAVRIGNSLDQLTFNAVGQHVFEIAGANVAYLTAAGLFPLVDAAKDVGTVGLAWRDGVFTRDLYAGSSLKLGASGDVNLSRFSAASIKANVAFAPQSYTVAGLPSAVTAGAGATAFCTNESGGAVPVFSDETNWRRVTDRAIVS